MGLAVDILHYCQMHGGTLTQGQRNELIAKFKARQIELQKEVDALQQGINMLTAAAAKPAAKKKTAKRRPRR